MVSAKGNQFARVGRSTEKYVTECVCSTNGRPHRDAAKNKSWIENGRCLKATLTFSGLYTNAGNPVVLGDHVGASRMSRTNNLEKFILAGNVRAGTYVVHCVMSAGDVALPWLTRELRVQVLPLPFHHARVRVEAVRGDVVRVQPSGEVTLGSLLNVIVCPVDSKENPVTVAGADLEKLRVLHPMFACLDVTDSCRLVDRTMETDGDIDMSAGAGVVVPCDNESGKYTELVFRNMRVVPLDAWPREQSFQRAVFALSRDDPNTLQVVVACRAVRSLVVTPAPVQVASDVSWGSKLGDFRVELRGEHGIVAADESVAIKATCPSAPICCEEISRTPSSVTIAVRVATEPTAIDFGLTHEVSAVVEGDGIAPVALVSFSIAKSHIPRTVAVQYIDGSRSVVELGAKARAPMEALRHSIRIAAGIQLCDVLTVDVLDEAGEAISGPLAMSARVVYRDVERKLPFLSPDGDGSTRRISDSDDTIYSYAGTDVSIGIWWENSCELLGCVLQSVCSHAAI